MAILSKPTIAHMIRYFGKGLGFGARTFSAVYPSKFLPRELVPSGKWRSPVTQPLLEEDIREFFSPSVHRPIDNNLSLAIHRSFEIFKLPSPVNPLHFDDFLKRRDLDIWNKSPGLPWTLEGFRTKDEVIQDQQAIFSIKRFIHRVKRGEDISAPDCLAFARAHVCDYGETKVRGVWGYPLTILSMEAMFALPLIEAYSRIHWNHVPVAFGLETANGGAEKVLRRFLGRGKFFVGLDFSKFDKTVPAWLIDIAFDIVLSNLDLTKYAEYGLPDIRHMLRMFEYIKEYFVNTKIRLANGLRLRKENGIPSGSYFTQLIGSICNAILINWMTISFTSSFPSESVFLGDDSLFCVDAEIPIEDIEWFFQQIGMKINAKKSQISSDLTKMQFLGYTLNLGLPTKPLEDWMTALCFPERPDQSFEDLQNRALGLYYAHFCENIYFSNLCKSIITMSPFTINFTRNFSRMLKHIGYFNEQFSLINLPNSIDFMRRLCLISTALT